MTTSHWFRPHQFSTPDISCDLIIVGAGYAGLSVAWWMSEYRPDLKIVVVDRSQVGCGASGRNAGFLTHGSVAFFHKLHEKWGASKTRQIFQYLDESIHLVHQHILKSSPEIRFDKTTSLSLVREKSLFEQWGQSQFIPERLGFIWKNSADLPLALQDKFYGAYENENEFRINPSQLIVTLKKLLKARKIQIIENNSAFEITPEGIVTEVNFIKSKQVALTLNGYFPQFHSAFKSLISSYRAQMLAVEVETNIDSNSLHYDSPERVYWRKSQDKILLIGGKRLLDEVEETGDFEKISPIVQSGLEKYLKEVLQVSYKVIHRWSGTMGFTPNELPILSRVRAPLPCFMLGGFSGHGMGFGFKAAQEMAEILAGNNRPSFFDSFASVNIDLI